MRKFDKDGLILCEMQGQVFETVSYTHLLEVKHLLE